MTKKTDAAEAPRRGRPVDPEAPERVPTNFRLPKNLYLQAREGARMEREPLTRVIERALEAYVKEMQRKHNGGKPFDVKE